MSNNGIVLLTKSYDVNCAKCAKFEADTYHGITRQKFERNLRILGWSKTREYGWICPQCALKIAGVGND
jgi:hypothetical protein